MYGTGAFSTIVAIGSFGLGWIVGSEMQKTLSNIAGLHFRFDTGYGGLNFACYYLSFSFIEYWNHRLFHYGIFWNFHRIHHTATAMNPLVEHRNHPIQHALEPLLLAWPLGLISVPVTDIFILSIIDQIYQLLVHSDVHWDWGWFGRWVLISPTAHRLHHSANPSHYGKNLSVLTIWDRLFGTWYAGDVPVVALGVDQNIYNKSSFVMDCWKDYTQCFFEITQWVQKINQKILAELSN